MGNAHASTSRRKRRLNRQRRLSAPDDNKLHPGYSMSSQSMGTTPMSSTPPRIQINGQDSSDVGDVAPLQRAHSVCADISSSSPSVSATLRRFNFLSSNSSQDSTGSTSMARSLDDGRSMSDMSDLQLKPLSRAKSHSPLKQMRTYSYRSLSSEENALDKQSCDLIRESWNTVIARANATGRGFGYFVFQRVFHKLPQLKLVFGMKADEELCDLPSEHESIRHTKIFTNIIHLAAKNVDELEAQVAPAIFKYGERHYSHKASNFMTEENVRMVCAQVVCTVCELLDEDAQPQCVEAWIEMMRYLGRKLLDGYEYAKLTAKHRISINSKDHHLFLML